MVSESWLLELLPALQRSGVQAQQAVRMVLRQGAKERRPETQRVPPVVREHRWKPPEQQALCAKVRPPARQVSQALSPAQEPVARSSLSPLQPSQPLPLLPLLPDPENAFVPAPRARYQSSLSASFFL